MPPPPALRPLPCAATAPLLPTGRLASVVREPPTVAAAARFAGAEEPSEDFGGIA
eukprot:CAMPEP_0117561324 /NCGR_PEP_ID=MMETSP0784-20121206/54352_1 /TAXON_ID=39447 /ORGANISM="" /LENGTH=54 /DNA_ID=CAMNT_0005358799 /DNA_START=183 /DNA_END=344 /DNA_ORIENTATION=+